MKCETYHFPSLVSRVNTLKKSLPVKEEEKYLERSEKLKTHSRGKFLGRKIRKVVWGRKRDEGRVRV